MNSQKTVIYKITWQNFAKFTFPNNANKDAIAPLDKYFHRKDDPENWKSLNILNIISTVIK